MPSCRPCCHVRWQAICACMPLCQVMAEWDDECSLMQGRDAIYDNMQPTSLAATWSRADTNSGNVILRAPFVLTLVKMRSQSVWVKAGCRYGSGTVHAGGIEVRWGGSREQGAETHAGCLRMAHRMACKQHGALQEPSSTHRLDQACVLEALEEVL
jgi:hypothetical protein